MQPTEVEEGTTDTAAMNRAMDVCKSSVFLGKNAAFLGSLLCSLNFVWSRSVPTAATDSITLWWNPEWFNSITKEARQTVLQHELWHAARLHMLRGQTRDPQIWNYACDIRINNDLESEKDANGNPVNSFVSIDKCWKDQSVDANGPMAEEDIYDLLYNQNQPPPKGGSWGGDEDGTGDLIPMSSSQQQTAINNVVQAVQQAKLANQAGTLPGDIEQILERFLEPIIPWRQVLMQFFTDMLDEDYSWKRPNRRYSDMYLPSRFLDDGRLEHLMYFLDVSGSVTEKDLLRFNSEVKYIQEVLKPEKLTLVQFDTRITAERAFEVDEPFSEIHIVGRGGTSFVPVREHIMKHKPTAAIIFSDMWCQPMEELDYDIPIIWVAIGNKRATVPFGKLIHID